MMFGPLLFESEDALFRIPILSACVKRGLADDSFRVFYRQSKIIARTTVLKVVQLR